MKLGVYAFGLATIATGLIDVVWGAFDPAEQPIQAFGDHVPGAHIFAYIVGLALIAAGVLVLNRRTARIGAPISMVAYALFAIFYLPRFITAPHYLGQHFSVYVSVLTGVCQNIIVICAAAILYALSTGKSSSRFATTIRWIFGLSVIVFGCNHLASLRGGAPFVPAWMPFGPSIWVAFTGAAFVLAGVAIVVRTMDVLAARLLALMLLVFSGATLLPFLVAAPRMEGNWGANAYNIVA
ncbi:MAG TPA: hypothetical protein VN936_08790, partial [Candidatus Acidoferrum sp.]|nr:hypothetical protein [Candidatus Acidoferrum sp.]